MTIEQVSQLLFALGGVSISVIGYFLRSALNELKDVKERCISTNTRLDVLERDYSLQLKYLNEKFDNLADAVDELTREIKVLNQKMK